MLKELTWFALCTRPRFEFKAEASLKEMGINTYLPTQKTLKKWSDRKKWITEPLFKSYCFIQINPVSYFIPLKAYGVVHYVWFEGKPAPIRDSEIEAIKKVCNSKLLVDVVSLNLKKGQIVKITNGPLTGISGEYIENKGKHNVLIRIDSINHGLIVSISPKHIVTC